MPKSIGRSTTAAILYALPAGDACLHLPAIVRAVHKPRSIVSRRMMILLKAGFVAPLRPNCYKLTEAGQRARDGRDIQHLQGYRACRHGPPRKVQGRTSIEAKVWKLLRMSPGKVTVADLLSQMTLGTKRQNVHRYIIALYRTGYLARHKLTRAGHRYVLMRDTGPQAPRLAHGSITGSPARGVRVWDENLRRWYA